MFRRVRDHLGVRGAVRRGRNIRGYVRRPVAVSDDDAGRVVEAGVEGHVLRGVSGAQLRGANKGTARVLRAERAAGVHKDPVADRGRVVRAGEHEDGGVVRSKAAGQRGVHGLAVGVAAGELPRAGYRRKEKQGVPVGGRGVRGALHAAGDTNLFRGGVALAVHRGGGAVQLDCGCVPAEHRSGELTAAVLGAGGLICVVGGFLYRWWEGSRGGRGGQGSEMGWSTKEGEEGEETKEEHCDAERRRGHERTG